WGSGGYAALISAIEEPSLFQCAVSIAGVTDPGDYAKYFSSLSANVGVKAFVGSGRDVTYDWAPVDRADEVRVPILLFHSRNDFHVPFRHSSGMQRALRRRDSPVQLVEYEDGEHGIYPEAYRLDMLTRLGDFVERHTAAGNEG